MTKTEIINKYIISGIPYDYIPTLCKELGINEGGLCKHLEGQTMMAVPSRSLVFESDIEDYINNKKNYD